MEKLATPRDRSDFPNLEGNTVLIVDDHHDSAQFLAELFEFCGATVCTASSAAQARQLLDQRGFSLVVCDMQMPHETGAQLMRWLRSRPDDRAAVAAVAVTAYPKEFLGTGDARAFNAFFLKPIEATDFLHTVATISPGPHRKRA